MDDLLRAEFGRSLGDAGVHILDPFAGTGNFIVRLMREIPKTRLGPKYAAELHCNEVMLLPYYIASMNIEHAYCETDRDLRALRGHLPGGHLRTGRSQTAVPLCRRKPGAGRAPAKDPDLRHHRQPAVQRRQVNENDNNKNRKYPVIDRRVAETYAKDSKATNKKCPVRPLRQGHPLGLRPHRQEQEGIVAFVTNNSFVDQIAFDGMRKHLAQDFD